MTNGEPEPKQEFVYLGSHDEINWIELWRGVVPDKGIVIEGAGKYLYQKFEPVGRSLTSEEISAVVEDRLADVRERLRISREMTSSS